jgi:hypothetical protein
MGHSRARRRHPWVAVEKNTDICGLIVCESRICEKVMKKILYLVC